MKRNLLTRLRFNGVQYIISMLFLLLVIPLYQTLVLNPTGFGNTLNDSSTGRFVAYLSWIGAHVLPFIVYRVLLLLAFAGLLSLPFSLYRIIVAQEIMAQQDQAEAEQDTAVDATDEQAAEITEPDEAAGMPEYAWRGKGFAVLAAWIGLLGLVIYLLGTLVSTLYFLITSTAAAGSTAPIASIFSISTNMVGLGLLGLGGLFFGAMICRTGRNLWPGIWVFFGYALMLTSALLCVSAIAVVSAPGANQSTLGSVATLLFALCVLWFGSMLARLKPE